MKAKFFDSLFNDRRDELAEITNELDSIICRVAEYQRHDSPRAKLAMGILKRAASMLECEDKHLETSLMMDQIDKWREEVREAENDTN